MVHSIGNYLFLTSLILLIIWLIWKGIGYFGYSPTNYQNNTYNYGAYNNDTPEELRERLYRQNRSIFRIFRSWMFWICIVGLVVGVVLQRV